MPQNPCFQEHLVVLYTILVRLAPLILDPFGLAVWSNNTFNALESLDSPSEGSARVL